MGCGLTIDLRGGFVVSLHWSKRFEADPGNRWLRGVIEALFRE
jgi:hypothetical protein